MPYHGQIADILAAWRAAEQRRDATPEATAEREAADVEVLRLRDEYQRVFRLQAGAVPPGSTDDDDADGAS